MTDNIAAPPKGNPPPTPFTDKKGWLPGGGGRLRADREALADNLGRAPSLAGGRDRGILERRPAFPGLGGQKQDGPEPELAGPLTLGEQGRGGQESPVKLNFVADEIEEGRPFPASALYGVEELAAVGELLGLPGLGQFDFDAKFDLGQDRIEPGIAGGGLEIRGRSRSRLTVEASRLPESNPILSSSSTSSAPLPRATERLRRSTGSSTPCSASSASILPAAFGAAAERTSSGTAVVSGSEKPVEPVRRGCSRAFQAWCRSVRRCASS